jgi:rod shape-determining protein MreD
MRFPIEEKRKKLTNTKLILYPLIAVILCLTQISLINFIEIGGLTPNLLIILTVWITISEGQFIGLFAGFGIGLLFDIFSLDVIGTNALAQTVAAFISGWFYKVGKENLILGNFRFILIVFLGAFVHNIIYFFLYLKVSELNFINFFLKYGIATSFYTTVFSVIVVLLKIPRREINR